MTKKNDTVVIGPEHATSSLAEAVRAVGMAAVGTPSPKLKAVHSILKALMMSLAKGDDWLEATAKSADKWLREQGRDRLDVASPLWGHDGTATRDEKANVLVLFVSKPDEFIDAAVSLFRDEVDYATEGEWETKVGDAWGKKAKGKLGDDARALVRAGLAALGVNTKELWATSKRRERRGKKRKAAK